MECSQNYAPTTFFPILSHLKNYLLYEKNIEIGEYPKLENYIKDLSKDYVPTKAPAFEVADLFHYIKTAPSSGMHLLNKVVFGFAFYGALRTCEITALTFEDIRESDIGITISTFAPKTNSDRRFIVQKQKMKRGKVETKEVEKPAVKEEAAKRAEIKNCENVIVNNYNYYSCTITK